MSSFKRLIILSNTRVKCQFNDVTIQHFSFFFYSAHHFSLPFKPFSSITATVDFTRPVVESLITSNYTEGHLAILDKFGSSVMADFVITSILCNKWCTL